MSSNIVEIKSAIQFPRVLDVVSVDFSFMKTTQTTKQRIETKKERIARLRKQIEALEAKEAKRIHAIAQKVGLYDITFNDDELALVLEAFVGTAKKNPESKDLNSESTD